MTKVCTKCGVEKELEEFPKHKECTDGHSGRCKACKVLRDRELREANPDRYSAYAHTPKALATKQKYYAENRERINATNMANYYKKSEARKKASREYYYKNREHNNERSRDYYQKNRVEIRAKCNEYKKNNRELFNTAFRKAKKEQPTLRMEYNLRSRMRIALNNASSKKKGHFWEIMGCTGKELKTYIEALFTESMSWDLYKEGEIHLDHIRPCASFDLSNAQEQKLCFNYRNLQPMWAKENLSKADKWSEEDNVKWLEKMKDVIAEVYAV